MEKEFVPYELAVKLKELGFDEECLGFYLPNKSFIIVDNDFYEKKIKSYAFSIFAPLWQQAFNWFRKEHNLHSFLSPKIKYPDNKVDSNEYHYTIIDNFKDYSDDGVRNYEEAREACLVKLIEIIKNENKS